MKRIGDNVYVHRSAVPELKPDQQRRVGQAEQAAGRPRWNVVRVGADSVSLLRVPGFGDDPHPALAESWKVQRGRVVDHRHYSGDTAPVYHRTELMLSTDDPRRQRLAATTAREERAGLLSRPDIGTVGAWERVRRGNPKKKQAADSRPIPASQAILSMALSNMGDWVARRYRVLQRMIRQRYGQRKTDDHLVVLSMGLGRDSITMLCLLAERNLVVEGKALTPENVDAVVFSDPGAEWEHSYLLIPRVRAFCDRIGVRFVVLEKPPAEGPDGWIDWVAKTRPGDAQEIAEDDSKGPDPPWIVKGRAMHTIEERAAAGVYHRRAPILHDYLRTRSITLRASAACTDQHKITPINSRFLGDLAWEQYGVGKGEWNLGKASNQANVAWGNLVRAGKRSPHWMLIGIAADELSRVEKGQEAKAQEARSFVRPKHPLVEMGITKAGEAPILERNGFGDVRKSGCMTCHWQPDSWWWVLSEVDPDTFVLAERMEHEANIKRVQKGESLRFLRGDLPLRETVDNWRARHPTATKAALLDKDYSMQRAGMCPVMQGALAVQKMVSDLKLTPGQKKMLQAAVAGEPYKRTVSFDHLVTKGVFDSEGTVLKVGHDVIELWARKAQTKKRKEQVRADIVARYAQYKQNPSNPAWDPYGPWGDPIAAFGHACHNPAHRRQNPRRRNPEPEVSEILYHCGHLRPGQVFDLAFAGSGEGRLGMGSVYGRGVYLTNSPEIVKLYCKYSAEPHLTRVRVHGKLVPPSYPQKFAARDRDGSVGVRAVIHRGIPGREFHEIAVYDTRAIEIIDTIPVSLGGMSEAEIKAELRELAQSRGDDDRRRELREARKALRKRNPTEASCKTAITRGGPSMPVTWLHDRQRITGTVLDYGSGHGADVEWLRGQGAKVTAYDPCHGPKRKPGGKYKTILATYVVNTVTPAEQTKIMAELKRLLQPGGTAYITVRSDVTGAGKTRSGTYQRDVRLRLPLVGSPGSARIYALEKR